MAYTQGAYPFHMENQTQANMYFHHPVQYTPHLQQHLPHSDVFFQPHLYSDYTEFLPLGLMYDDYDENVEVSTRPRLTKEQVEVLEAQFQAHPKPNSMVKKQLALQTKLTLPRVANWFQNRRAKAKQQRKQEEFESQQNMTASWKEENVQDTAEPSSKTSSPVRKASELENESNVSDARSPVKSPLESTTESSWRQLQRALGMEESLQQQQAEQQRQRRQQSRDQLQATLAMPPPEFPHSGNPSATLETALSRTQPSSMSPTSDWGQTQSLTSITLPPTVPMHASLQECGFDFGFDRDVSSTSQSNTVEDSPEIASQQYYISPEDWPTAFQAHTSMAPDQGDYTSAEPLSPLALPAYPGSRRGSGSDELTAEMGTFALAGTPPVHTSASIKTTDGEIDIASRRKRPRPAALTSAALTSSSLRSRSYGQLTSTSPAFRPGPPGGNGLRHVKSTGHSLNSHYAGIRKCSLPQKSPLNLASFAEAEALKRIMAQQTTASSQSPLTTPVRTDVSQTFSPHDLLYSDTVEEQASMMLPSEVLAQYQQLQSPPHTPFQSDYVMQATAASMPPPSVRSQYANFEECTPPYSAGPLTSSTCWSDAPLHSPDVTGFPAGHMIGSLTFAPQQESFIQHWISPPEGGVDLGLQHLSPPDDKKTEFFITEFPGQREEYANIAQQVLQPKPKNYVFANTAASDYDG